MSIIKRQSPAGYVIFCDEIRQEMTGKLIYIGVYPGNDMTVVGDSWPVTIQKLTLIIAYYENKDTFLSLSEILVCLPGESEDKPSFRFPPPSQEALTVITPPSPSDDDGDIVKGLTTSFGFSPLTIKQEGRLKVIARIGNDSLKLGSLYIRRAPVPDEMKLPT